jgi:hypothetical protein
MKIDEGMFVRKWTKQAGERASTTCADLFADLRLAAAAKHAFLLVINSRRC